MGENEGDHLEIPLDDVVNNQLTLFNLVACSTPPSLALLLIEHNREREEASRPRVTALSEVTRTCVAGTGKKQIDFVMINSSPQVRRETKERTPSGSLSALFFPHSTLFVLFFFLSLSDSGRHRVSVTLKVMYSFYNSRVVTTRDWRCEA